MLGGSRFKRKPMGMCKCRTLILITFLQRISAYVVKAAASMLKAYRENSMANHKRYLHKEIPESMQKVSPSEERDRSHFAINEEFYVGSQKVKLLYSSNNIIFLLKIEIY
jgi:hypothetical protein